MCQFTWKPSKGSQTLPRSGSGGLIPPSPTLSWKPSKCSQTLPRLRTRQTRSSRRAWLAALPVWACACVVPVAPEFEDPAGNYAPYVVSSVPAAGAVLPASADTPTATDAIEVTLGDPNLEDKLEVRWLIDYPPYDSTLSREALDVRLPSSGAVKRESIRFAPSCADIQSASGLPSHRVTLSVADRPFLPPNQASPDLRWDSVSAEGFVVRTTWTVALSCR